MTANEGWAELSDRLEALALKLRLHLQQAGAADGVPQALGELRDKVEDAFTAAGNAVQDDAVRADVRDVGRLLAEAVSATLAKVSDDVRDVLERQR
ncbi:MAG TPA: hypothetical protein VFR67_18205 [Pilimelia sp.]|nr:hypothetical protein [Pilimelia sp.]